MRRGADPRRGGLLWGGRWQWVLGAMGGRVGAGSDGWESGCRDRLGGMEVDIWEALVGSQ